MDILTRYLKFTGFSSQWVIGLPWSEKEKYFHCKHDWPISLEIVESITNMGKRI